MECFSESLPTSSPPNYLLGVCSVTFKTIQKIIVIGFAGFLVRKLSHIISSLQGLLFSSPGGLCQKLNYTYDVCVNRIKCVNISMLYKYLLEYMSKTSSPIIMSDCHRTKKNATFSHFQARIRLDGNMHSSPLQTSTEWTVTTR